MTASEALRRVVSTGDAIAFIGADRGLQTRAQIIDALYAYQQAASREYRRLAEDAS